MPGRAGGAGLSGLAAAQGVPAGSCADRPRGGGEDAHPPRAGGVAGGCGRTAPRWSSCLALDRGNGVAPEALPEGTCRRPSCRRGCSVGSGSCWSCRTRSFSDLTNTRRGSDQELLQGSGEGAEAPAGDAGGRRWCGVPRGCEVLAAFDASGGDGAVRGGWAGEAHGAKPTVILDAGISGENIVGFGSGATAGSAAAGRCGRRRRRGRRPLRWRESRRFWRGGVLPRRCGWFPRREGKRASGGDLAWGGTGSGRDPGPARHLHEGLTIPHRRKQYEKVMDTWAGSGSGIGRCPQYEVEVEKGAGPNATAVVWSRAKRRGAGPGAGSYLLRSSQTGSEQIVRTYWRLTEIERRSGRSRRSWDCPIWHGAQPDRGAPLPGGLAYPGSPIRTRLKARDIPCRGPGVRSRCSA